MTSTDPDASNQVWIPSGSLLMGSEDFYPEEGPVRRVEVDGFWIDREPVTVGAFGAFVDETAYVTVAERDPIAADYPDADPDLLVPGALVFHPTSGPVDLSDVRNWWSYVAGASWRAPEGPGTTNEGRGRHPVTQVAFEDAEAYATWVGRSLPNEAEWEYAARGGLEGATFAWGEAFAPDDTMMANTWQGEFPWQNLLFDGYERTSPVGSFRANGYGLVDMIGNTWEWTVDDIVPEAPSHPCCGPSVPRTEDMGPAGFRRKVIKGGSHLCAPNYCLRYRPAARSTESMDTATGHLGFRCVTRPGTPGAPSSPPPASY